VVTHWSFEMFSWRRVWKYQRGNQIPYTEEQTTQWPKEKVQKDKQWSTKHTYKTKDRVTRTPLKIGDELRCSGRVSSSCSSSDTRRVNIVANQVNLWYLIPFKSLKTFQNNYYDIHEAGRGEEHMRLIWYCYVYTFCFDHCIKHLLHQNGIQIYI
jgi:hypothetical protein